MSRDTGIDAQAAAAILSEITETEFRPLGPLAGGETGAYEFLAPDGRSVVVKWDTTPDGRSLRGEAVVLSERLRHQAGWPVPSESVLDADDVRFVIQEFMPGTAPTRIDHELVDQLFALHIRRLGLAEPHDPIRWPMNLIATLTTGGNGYCRHESLRDYSERTRSLIERIEAFGRSLDVNDFVGNDVVHWDLHPGNLLVDGANLSAVVDTDFALVGDAAFDLVMLALTCLRLECAPGVRSRLFAQAFDHIDELRAQAYLAHLFVRLLDWPIRRNSLVEVDFWLAHASRLLTI
jgi:thiamine kinase-like enzyme